MWRGPTSAFTMAGEERAPVTWAAALPGAPGQLTLLGDILARSFAPPPFAVESERAGVPGSRPMREPSADQRQRARSISVSSTPHLCATS